MLSVGPMTGPDQWFFFYLTRLDLKNFKGSEKLPHLGLGLGLGCIFWVG
jgi:hypothetical protein